MNQEIEAHFAQYLYLKKLKEFSGSKWEKWYTSGDDERMMTIKNLERHITNKGELDKQSTSIMLETYMEYTVIKAFRNTPGYEDCKFDTGRDLMSTFKNIQTLTKDC